MKKSRISLLMTPTPLFHRGFRWIFHLTPFTVTASLAPSEVFSPMGRLRIWVWRKALINCIRNKLNHLTSGACHSEVIGQSLQQDPCVPWKTSSQPWRPGFLGPFLQVQSGSQEKGKVDQQKTWGCNQRIQTLCGFAQTQLLSRRSTWVIIKSQLLFIRKLWKVCDIFRCLWANCS